MMSRGNSEKIRMLEPMTLRLLCRVLTRGNSETRKKIRVLGPMTFSDVDSGKKKDPSARTNDFATTFSDVDSGKLGENPNARTNDFAAIFSDVNSGKLGLA